MPKEQKVSRSYTMGSLWTLTHSVFGKVLESVFEMYFFCWRWMVSYNREEHRFQCHVGLVLLAASPHTWGECQNISESPPSSHLSLLWAIVLFPSRTIGRIRENNVHKALGSGPDLAHSNQSVSPVLYDTEMFRAQERNEEVGSNSRVGIGHPLSTLIEVCEGALCLFQWTLQCLPCKVSVKIKWYKCLRMCFVKHCIGALK